jgi:hypothetical protein
LARDPALNPGYLLRGRSAEHLLAPDHIDAAARPSGRIDGKQAHVEIVRLKSASRFDFLTPDGQH